MPAAAYMKSQQYLAWAMERSAHFIDPALSYVLRTSMTGDDNDLFASNLVGKPLLALHGCVEVGDFSLLCLTCMPAAMTRMYQRTILAS